ncbi:MAG: hypothetical protein K2X32_01830 [Phycisphaerales bacterium]|nr:hypothetical protein [Phycisphaerales bacterium]
MRIKNQPPNPTTKKPRASSTPAFVPLNRHDLYEICVQRPEALIPLLRAIHAGEPKVLGEDFCAGAACARHWVKSIPAGVAYVADIDPEPLRRVRAWHVEQTPEVARRLIAKRLDVLKKSASGARSCDVLFTGNFSIGEIHSRDDLVSYLNRSRNRLKRNGVLICDTYGGETAFTRGSVQRIHPVPPALTGSRASTRVRYTWQQRTADPLTARVENAIHFRVEQGGEIVQELTDAFVYHWRLWSVPELRDAMLEAGFRRVEIYAQLIDAEDSEGNAYAHPVTDPSELDESFIVCVVGRG